MTDATIAIARLDTADVRVPIVGVTPLLMHRMSEKNRKMMLDATQGRRSPREAKDPEAEWQAACYRLKDDGYGLPSVAFKAATVSAARFYGRDVTMTALRQYLFFRGEPGLDGQMMTRIEGTPERREDVVRVGNGGTDLRYRPMFNEWTATLEVTFIRASITLDSVLSLIDAGGLGVGVGDWRPERGGDFGTFRIDPTRNVETLEVNR